MGLLAAFGFPVLGRCLGLVARDSRSGNLDRDQRDISLKPPALFGSDAKFVRTSAQLLDIIDIDANDVNLNLYCWLGLMPRKEVLWRPAFAGCVIVAALAPIVVSRVILNEIIPCTFTAVSRFDLSPKFVAATIPAGLFEALYSFGISAAFVVLLSLASTAISFYYAGSTLRVQGAILKLIGAGAIISVAAARLPLDVVSPHSCISASLIDLTLGTLPEEAGHGGIGNVGSSIKGVFALVYRLVLLAGASAVICIAVAIGDLTARIAFQGDPKVESADDTKNTNAAMSTLTVLLFIVSISFAVMLVAAKSYFSGGERLIADTDLLAAYKSFTSSIILHWGGVGSGVIGCVFSVALGGIILARDRRELSWLTQESQLIRSLANVVAISVPVFTATVQQYLLTTTI